MNTDIFVILLFFKATRGKSLLQFDSSHAETRAQ
jgi:hypothetical protein